ncbi:hypothetical protein ACWDBW_47050 [Streptomyces sp. NPDC001107]
MQDGIFIAAPPGTDWPLTMEEFEARIRERCPDVLCTSKHAVIGDEDYLAFEADIDDERRHGSYFDHAQLILRDAPPAFWADTIVWFLSLLPAGTPAVAMVETNPDIAPVPPGASADEIRNLLEGLQDAA